jgi:hypothetical protein
MLDRPAPHLEPQQEYTFFKLITAFMHGIFTGAIGLRHSSALLAHYGRLDITYDYCVKALIDVLRDEGMYKDNGTQVAEVIFQAVTEVSQVTLVGIVFETYTCFSPSICSSMAQNRRRSILSSLSKLSCLALCREELIWPSCAGWKASIS